ncbi:cell wall metabolism sensor histidine kinase WalK [Curtobacterium sp. 9128]|uniref:sensor histidine kinase n=1 Tax=Curtobacterium sp. 9128 TaxID=1793722 RepID=UPI0011A3C0AF|nr:HAMP domain-containing sensor histidine kinase [Curtobacterium sp. 9128]
MRMHLDHDDRAGQRAFRNQLGVVAGIMPVVAFVLVVDRGSVSTLALIGTALPLAALVATAAAPPSIDPRWFAAVLAADVASIAFIRGDVPSIGVSALFTLPALWSGYAFGFRGAAVTSTVAVGLLWFGAPGEWIAIDADDTARLVSLPLIIAAVSGTAAALARRGRARQELLHAQTELLRRRLAEVEAREELVRAVLDSVDFDVLAFDDAGRTTVTNSGRGGGVGLDDLADCTAATNLQTLVRRTLEGTELEEVLVPVRRPDGVARTYTVSTRLLPDEGGGGGVLVARDVTAERSALEARDDLVSSVSHELRTPTTAVLGSVELAREVEGLPADAERLLDVASRNAERLVELVGGILTAAREEQVDLVLAPCDLLDVIDAAVEAAEPAARVAGVELRIGTADAPVRVVADAFRIRQVVDNLVSNAVKYNHDGGWVDIGAHAVGDRVWLIVRDDGVGIADADQDRLFERFFRAESVRSTGIHGTGLGLRISRQIAQRHGGDLAVTSTLGEGTTVTMTLPAAGPERTGVRA